MLQSEAQLVSKLKGKKNTAHHVHSHRNSVSLIPFLMTQTMSKNIHQFVKELWLRSHCRPSCSYLSLRWDFVVWLLTSFFIVIIICILMWPKSDYEISTVRIWVTCMKPVELNTCRWCPPVKVLKHTVEILHCFENVKVVHSKLFFEV